MGKDAGSDPFRQRLPIRGDRKVGGFLCVLAITDFNQDTRNIRAEQDLEGAGLDPSVPDGEGLFLHDGEGTFLDRVGEAAGFLTANRRRGGRGSRISLMSSVGVFQPGKLARIRAA